MYAGKWSSSTKVVTAPTPGREDSRDETRIVKAICIMHAIKKERSPLSTTPNSFLWMDSHEYVFCRACVNVIVTNDLLYRQISSALRARHWTPLRARALCARRELNCPSFVFSLCVEDTYPCQTLVVDLFWLSPFYVKKYRLALELML